MYSTLHTYICTYLCKDAPYVGKLHSGSKVHQSLPGRRPGRMSKGTHHVPTRLEDRVLLCGSAIVRCSTVRMDIASRRRPTLGRVGSELCWTRTRRTIFSSFFLLFFFPRESSHRNVKFWVATVVNEIIWNRPVKASLPACKKNTSAQARLRQTSPPPLPFRLSVTETGQIDRIG